MNSRLVIAAAAAAAALAAPAGHAANECDNFLSCIPVAGPWVAVPAPSTANAFPSARWYLRCPQGIVGGLDAEISDERLDINFPGFLGAPINPGITATNEILFEGRYTGRPRIRTTYRPFIGCIPAAGGTRTPTARAAPAQVGRPTVLRIRTLNLRAGRLLRATHSCRSGERLITATHAVGFRTQAPPQPSRMAAVRVVRTERAGKILLSATRPGLAPGIRVQVQIQALCTRGTGP